MTVTFYLTIEGKKYTLPVPPGSITLKKKVNSQTSEVIKLGEVNNQLAKRRLVTFSISSIFPKNKKDKASYINSKATKKHGLDWVKLIQNAMNKQQRVRVILSGAGVNILCLIEGFEHSIEDATKDTIYTIDFVEYRPVKVIKKVKKKTNVKSSGKDSNNSRPKPQNNKPIAAGTKVLVNGRLYRTSTGTGAGATEKDAQRIINLISKGAKCPYHVTTLNGGWRGWVSAGSVKRA